MPSHEQSTSQFVYYLRLIHEEEEKRDSVAFLGLPLKRARPYSLAVQGEERSVLKSLVCDS